MSPGVAALVALVALVAQGAPPASKSLLPPSERCSSYDLHDPEWLGKWWPSSVRHVFVVFTYDTTRPDDRAFFYWRRENPLVVMGRFNREDASRDSVSVYASPESMSYSRRLERWCSWTDLSSPYPDYTEAEGPNSMRHHWLSHLAFCAYARRAKALELTLDGPDSVYARPAVTFDADGLPVEALDPRRRVRMQVFYRPPTAEELLPHRVPWLEDPTLPVKVPRSEECARMAAEARLPQKADAGTSSR